MRRLLILMALGLSGCATGATEAQIDGVNKALADCYVSKAHLFDDRTSDALSIGQIVVAACQPELNELIAARGSRLSRAASAEYARLAVNGAPTDAAMAVALVRRGVR